ncbi:hypothetical protein HanXRQr2_Chr06g0246871 [Helianthus annuus]|uniref:Uncharacterized protein n=1 Tax=Helianthus annuus TaxID=4232 RepID=A0A9K3IQX2_HELAN|nr:hypothetical protein HanXRQr2_Chr06g0246871 [Helianthus annuus]
MQEATSNLSAAINTSSSAGADVTVKVLLYMKLRSSISAASSMHLSAKLLFVALTPAYH